MVGLRRRCEVDLAVPEHAADVVVAEGHEVVARGGDEGLAPAAVRRGDEEELARRVSRRQVRGELLQRLYRALPVAGLQEREHGREVPGTVGDPPVRYREQAEAGQQVAAGVREEPLAGGEGVGHDGRRQLAELGHGTCDALGPECRDGAVKGVEPRRLDGLVEPDGDDLHPGPPGERLGPCADFGLGVVDDDGGRYPVGVAVDRSRN